MHLHILHDMLQQFIFCIQKHIFTLCAVANDAMPLAVDALQMPRLPRSVALNNRRVAIATQSGVVRLLEVRATEH